MEKASYYPEQVEGLLEIYCNSEIGADEALRKDRDYLLSITSGSEGTAIYY